jgi:diguanylate cyclase (GGDEF)-like protein/PAS domain S-box-containing protein
LYTSILVLINVAGVLLYPRLVPGVDYVSTGNPLYQLIFASILILIAAALYRRDLVQLEEQSYKLTESERSHQLILETAQDAIIMMDAEGLVTGWNHSAETIFGWSNSEMLGQALHDRIVPPRYREEHARGLQHFLATGEGPLLNTTIEMPALHRDGHEFPVELSISPGKLGETYTFSAFVRDISRRKQAEQTLRESQELFEEAFELNPAMMSLSRVTDDLYINVNESYERILGYKRAEVIGQTSAELNLYPNRDREVIVKAMLFEQGFLHDYEGKLRTKSGTIIDTLTSMRIIELNGEPCVLSVSRDITEQKHVEEALRQSERRFQLAAWATKDVIWERDLVANTIWWNQSLRKLFHYSGEDIQPTVEWWEQHIHPDEQAKVINSIRSALEQAEDFWSKEYRFRQADGSYADIFDRGYILYGDENKPVQMIGAMMDITERKLAEKNLEKKTSQMELLSRMSHLLQSCLTMQEAYTIVGQMAPQLFTNEAGVLFIINSSRDLLESVVSWGEVSLREGVLTPEDCRALQRSQLYVVTENAQSGSICRHLGERPLPNGYLCVPLMAQGETIGVLHVQSSSAPVESQEVRQQLARAMAESIGLALANLQLRETLRQQSIRDALTGLFNRRYMEETLEREVQRAARNQEPLGIIMIDIDHFKQFNDTHGHEAGDVLLREFGKLLRSQTREADIACRYGGEEFILIMPGASLAIAQKRAEALCKAIKQLNVRYNSQLLEAVTLSAGVSAYPETGSSGLTTVNAADSALYQAKHAGRDRVVVAEQIPPSPPASNIPQRKIVKSILSPKEKH